MLTLKVLRSAGMLVIVFKEETDVSVLNVKHNLKEFLVGYETFNISLHFTNMISGNVW